MTAQPSDSSLAIQRSPPEGPLAVPVLLLVFNRRDQTSNVFEAIREAQPERLYMAADGRDLAVQRRQRSAKRRERSSAGLTGAVMNIGFGSEATHTFRAQR